MLFPNTVDEAKRAAKEIQAPLKLRECRTWESRVRIFPRGAGFDGYKVLYHPSGAILLRARPCETLTELKESGHITMDPKVFSSFRQDIYGMMVCRISIELKGTNCLGSAAGNGGKP